MSTIPFWLNIVVTIALAISVAFVTTLVLLKNYPNARNPNKVHEQRFVEPHGNTDQPLEVFSTPTKADQFVIRSKEIQDEIG